VAKRFGSVSVSLQQPVTQHGVAEHVGLIQR
jgi:hypothetical protein